MLTDYVRSHQILHEIEHKFIFKFWPKQPQLHHLSTWNIDWVICISSRRANSYTFCVFVNWTGFTFLSYSHNLYLKIQKYFVFVIVFCFCDVALEMMPLDRQFLILYSRFDTIKQAVFWQRENGLRMTLVALTTGSGMSVHLYHLCRPDGSS